MTFLVLSTNGANELKPVIVSATITVRKTGTTDLTATCTYNSGTGRLQLVLSEPVEDGTDYYVPAWQEGIRGDNGEWFAPWSFIGLPE